LGALNRQIFIDLTLQISHFCQRRRGRKIFWTLDP
jgi:hypothetical protein